MNTILQINNISKLMQNQLILNDINLDIYKGKVYGLIGKNGAGKTTLMKIVAGLIAPSKGCIEYSSASLRIGVLIEEPAAYGWLSGFSNLKILARMYENMTNEYLDYIINLVGLNEHIHKRYDTYSVGMKRRLGIAMALLNKPDLLLLDEPTNGLDYEGVCEIRSLILSLSKEFDCTIILSSHILAELDKICDNAVFIDNGEIIKNIDKATIEHYGIEQKYRELISKEGVIA